MAVSVERNSVAWNFNEFELQRGKKKGQKVLVPEQPDFKNSDSVAQFLAWIGAEQVVRNEFAKTRQLSIGWTRSATPDDTKVLSEAAFQKYASEFSVRGETIKDLSNQVEELLAEMAVVNNDTSLSKADKGMKIVELFVEVSKLREVIEAKRRGKEDDEDEDDKPAVAAA